MGMMDGFEQALPVDFLLPGEVNLLYAITRASQTAMGTNDVIIQERDRKAIHYFAQARPVAANPRPAAE